MNPGTQADLVKESNANYKDQTDPGCLHGTHYIIQGGSFSYGDFGDMYECRNKSVYQIIRRSLS